MFDDCCDIIYSIPEMNYISNGKQEGTMSEYPSTIVIPRYFDEAGVLKRLSSDKAFGVEFRINTDVPRYALITATSALVFVLQGDKIIHQPNRNIVVSDGMCVFIPRGSHIVSDTRSRDGEFRRIVLFLEDSFLQEILALLPGKERVSHDEAPFPVLEVTPLLQQSLSTLQPYLQGELVLGEQLLRNKLQEILLTLLESDRGNLFYQAFKKAVSAQKMQLRTFMEEMVTKPLTVSEFAHLSCRSVRQFSRDFQELFGVSAGEWIRKKRLEHAYHLIHTTDEPLSEICSASGFRSYSHFIQLFGKEYGITPKQLQLQNR